MLPRTTLSKGSVIGQVKLEILQKSDVNKLLAWVMDTFSEALPSNSDEKLVIRPSWHNPCSFCIFSPWEVNIYLFSKNCDLERRWNTPKLLLLNFVKKNSTGMMKLFFRKVTKRLKMPLTSMASMVSTAEGRSHWSRNMLKNAIALSNTCTTPNTKALLQLHHNIQWHRLIANYFASIKNLSDEC